MCVPPLSERPSLIGQDCSKETAKKLLCTKKKKELGTKVGKRRKQSEIEVYASYLVGSVRLFQNNSFPRKATHRYVSQLYLLSYTLSRTKKHINNHE